MKKNLKYYMSLPYTIIVNTEDDNNGPCFVARLKEVPYLIGTGETPEKALKEMEINKRLKFKTDIDMGLTIPEPVQHTGQFHIRIQPSLQEALAQMAEFDNVSLNQYINTILSRAVGAKEAQEVKTLKRVTAKS